MRKIDIQTVLAQDEQDGCGEIVNTDELGTTYLDFKLDLTTRYMCQESITDEIIKDLIYLGKNIVAAGLTKEHIIAVLKKAFGDDYYDAVCTLTGIIIPSNEAEFYEMLIAANLTSDVMEEWYEWEDQAECVGRMFSAHQIVFINEAVIDNLSKILFVYKTDYEKEYQIGIITTLIHEMRHLMLETNVFLPEDEFPESEKAEDAVEAFSREKYELLEELSFWKKSSEVALYE